MEINNAAFKYDASTILTSSTIQEQNLTKIKGKHQQAVCLELCIRSFVFFMLWKFHQILVDSTSFIYITLHRKSKLF